MVDLSNTYSKIEFHLEDRISSRRSNSISKIEFHPEDQIPSQRSNSISKIEFHPEDRIPSRRSNSLMIEESVHERTSGTILGIIVQINNEMLSDLRDRIRCFKLYQQTRQNAYR